VPEKDISDYYAKNSSRFEQAFIKIIAIGFCPAAPSTKGTSVEDIKKAAEAAVAAAHCKANRTENQAFTIAGAIAAKARAGEDFVKLVKQSSEDDESKASDGDFPLVTRTNSTPDPIKQAVFGLKSGETSDPVQFGSFVYVIRMRERTVQPLTSLYGTIVGELKQKHFIEWNDEVNKRFKPVIERPDFFQPAAATPAKPGPPQLIPPSPGN
jgi:hypothetical protein